MRCLKRFFCMIAFLIMLVPVIVDGSSTIVMDLDSGRLLYENNSQEKKLIASTTKIMTCLIALENSNLNSIVTVGEEILPMYGTNIYLEVGEKIKVIDLLYGLMLRSGNDAAVVLANYISGDEEKFVALMNQKAEELGMKNTHFNNSHGLDENTQNYSTAYDMALLSKYAYTNKVYRQIVSTKKYFFSSSLKPYSWYNRMRLLHDYKYCIGGKNGYTPKAGKTLVSLAEKNHMIITIVTLDDSDIYMHHKQLYEKYYMDYHLYTIVDKDHFNLGYHQKNKYYIKASFSYPLQKQEIDKVDTLIHFYSAENKKHEVGEIQVLLNHDTIGVIPIYQTQKKKDSSIFQKIKKLFLR